MSDLTEFLLARIAEDEAAALAASPGPWHLNAEGDEVIAVDDIEVATAFALSNNQLRATAEHIARHDPARVLAECDAKRRIVEWRPAIDAPGPMLEVVHAEVQRQREYVWKLLALPYADHPDYREEWRP